MEGKGNDGKGDIPERDLWTTKQDLWDTLNRQYKFEFDCCANKENSKCIAFSGNFETCGEILEVCWINPPFSKSAEMFTHFFKVVRKGIAIYRCDNMETKVWQDIILKHSEWVFIPSGRVSYTPFEIGDMRGGRGTRFPSALIGIGLEPPCELNGTVLFVKKMSGVNGTVSEIIKGVRHIIAEEQYSCGECEHIMEYLKGLVRE
jgi:hypothetical protein